MRKLFLKNFAQLLLMLENSSFGSVQLILSDNIILSSILQSTVYRKFAYKNIL